MFKTFETEITDVYDKTKVFITFQKMKKHIVTCRVEKKTKYAWFNVGSSHLDFMEGGEECMTFFSLNQLL